MFNIFNELIKVTDDDDAMILKPIFDCCDITSFHWLRNNYEKIVNRKNIVKQLFIFQWRRIHACFIHCGQSKDHRL